MWLTMPLLKMDFKRSWFLIFLEYTMEQHFEGFPQSTNAILSRKEENIKKDCKLKGCSNKLDEYDTHGKCVIHRKCISRSSLSYAPDDCETCQSLLTDQEGQFVDKMINLIAAWRKLNGQDQITDMRKRCIHRNYQVPLLSDQELKETLKNRVLVESLYENSKFVDIRLDTSGGNIYSHKFIIASRYPCCWYLISELIKLQKYKTVGNDSVLAVDLPDIRFDLLERFIRSLYSYKIDESCAHSVIFLLKRQLSTSKAVFSPQEHRIYLEKLNEDEEREIQNVILHKLKIGEISEKKGNLRVLAQQILTDRQLNWPRSSIAFHKPISSLKSSSKVFQKIGIPSDYQSNFPYKSIKSSCAVNISVASVNESICIGKRNSDSLIMNSDSLAGISKERESISSEANEDSLNSRLAKSTANLSKEGGCHIEQIVNLEYLIHSEDIIKNSNSTKEASSSGINVDSIISTSVKEKVRKLETKTGKPLSTVEKISSSCYKNKHSIGSDCNIQSLCLEDDNVDDGNISESEQAGINDTSSLEVELPSSQGDQSLSPDFDKYDFNSDSDNNSKEEGNMAQDIEATTPVIGAAEVLCEEKEISTFNINPHKPLVRTRTFDLIEPTCDSIHLEDITYNFPNDNERTNFDNVNIPRSQQIICNSGSDLDVEKTSNAEIDPEKLKELERLKGSLLFEHHLQTFSNIPSTNLMVQNSALDTNTNSIYNGNIGPGMLEETMHKHSTIGNQSADLVIKSIPRSAAPSSVGDILSNPFVNRRVLQPLIPQKSQEEMALELHEEIARRGPDTRSPSPDSLSLDMPLSSEKLLVKECSHFEEKEKDDFDSNDLSILTSEKDKIYDHKKIDTTSQTLNYSNTASPRILRRSENFPIVSGGSTLRKESVSSKETSSCHTMRQISAGLVKDIDAIPVVCGFIDPKEDRSDEVKQLTLMKKGDKDNGSKTQSIFSMFINLDEIATPEKESDKDDGKKSHPTGGMYMFIEADAASSPKVKRKNRFTSEDHRSNKSNQSKGLAEASHVSSSISEKKLLMNEESNSSDFCNKGDSQSTTSYTMSEESCSRQVELTDNCSNESNSKDSGKKRGFFFIEADSTSKSGSPKLNRRNIKASQHKFKADSNVMSKSAPSDSHLFKKDGSLSTKSSTPEFSLKLMTKSVIDREEFMAQPPARRNVSLNDKINESSKIPRPVNNFKEKLLACQKDFEIPQKLNKCKNFRSLKSVSNKRRPKVIEQTKSLETSISEGAASLSTSFNEAISNSMILNIEDNSEISDVSSLLSSIERSSEPDQDGKETHSALGNDLLKMLLNEINTDVTIQVGESKIGAHKCILASRCVYFAAMFSGHWVESAGNVIKLQGFSVEAVMEALKHIYSGNCSVPEGTDIKELAALADMLALDGLKEVVSLHLKATKCHYFHKPCPECLPGVLEILPIAAAYCLDELYHKCLKWVAKNFIAILPTRNFSSLPSELQDRCLKQIMDDMSVNNVIDTALGAEKIVSSLPVVRWAQSAFDLVAQLIEYATNFIAVNLKGVLESDRFIFHGKDGGWNVDSLEKVMKVACDMVKPDQAVLSHIQLTTFLNGQDDFSTSEYSEAFLNMCSRLLNQIEKFIIHNLNRVSVCRKWPLLPTEIQKRIKDAAQIVYEFSKPIALKPNLTSGMKSRSRGTSLEPNPRVRASSMSDHRLSRSASASVVQPSKGIAAKRLNSAVGRCHTPPPSVLRTSLQTPPPTRASTLRAQARQVAIQRSQSARTVVEKTHSKVKQLGPDLSIDNEDFTSISNSIFSRGGTFTRSISKSEQSHGRPRTPNLSFSLTSRSSIPGRSDKICHNRNASEVTTLFLKPGGIADESFQENHMVTYQGHHTSVVGDTSSNSSKFLRAHSMEVGNKCSSTGATSFHSSLPRQKVAHINTSSQTTEVQKANDSLIENCGRNFKYGQQTHGQKSRVPLKESTQGTFYPEIMNSHDGNNPFDADDSCRESTSGNTRGDLPMGLGCRSNTFCKDDLPNTGENLVENEK